MKNLSVVFLVSIMSLSAFAHDKEVKETEQIETTSESQPKVIKDHLDLIESNNEKLTFFIRKNLSLPTLSLI